MYNNLINCFGEGVGSNQGRQIFFFYVLNYYRAFHMGIHLYILSFETKICTYLCISVSTNSLFGHVFTMQCARMYVYVHVLFVHVTKLRAHTHLCM